MPSQVKTLSAGRARQTSIPLPLKAVLVLLGVGVLTAAAHIAIPFWPVPMTMQSGTVLLLGAAYGSGLAEATLIAYLAAGAVGIPVFAAGAGIAYLSGPTAGYLLGFLAAASFMGFCASRGWMRSVIGTVAAFLGGGIIIYAFGLGWLSVLLGTQKAVALGLVPFLPAEATKIAMAILLFRAGHMIRSR
ncbi:MAG: biotin transporter BioY [Proteobacteria bacterium]|nr:biotin transporter BioY [Pseudomonadota bacterium]